MSGTLPYNTTEFNKFNQCVVLPAASEFLLMKKGNKNIRYGLH